MSLAAGLIVSALLALQRPSVETYLHMSDIGEAGFTPDGRTAIVQTFAAPFAAKSFDNETLYDAQRSRLRFVDLVHRRSRAQPSDVLAALPGPCSPSGARMAVLRPRGRRLQLGVLRLADKTVSWLSVDVEPPGLGRALQWRSEAELVVLSPARGMISQSLQEGAAAERRMQEFWRRQRVGRSASVSEPFPTRALSDGPRRLLAVDLVSGRVRSLASGPITDFEISPDGQTAALLSRGDARPLADARSLSVAEHLRQTRLSLLDIASGRQRSACGGDIMPTLLSWSPRSATLLTAWRDPRDFTWARMHVALVDRRGGCADLLIRDAALDPQTANGEDLPVILSGWRDGRPLARLSLGGGPAQWLSLSPVQAPMTVADPPEAAHEAFTGAARLRLQTRQANDGPNDRLLAQKGVDRITVHTDEQGVSEVRLRTADAETVIDRLNPHLARIRWATVLPLKSPGGLHWLYLPKARTSPPPLVILPYPGAAFDTAPAAYQPGSSSLVTQAQLAAAQGYAVLVPSLPPPQPGRADAGVAAEVLAALKVAAASGLVDTAAVALWGHSFGGYAAIITAEASPRFRLVIAEHAPLDLISSRGVQPPFARAFDDLERYLEFQYGWTERGQAGFGATPQRVGAAYLDASAVSHADRITTPVLLINGDQDFVAAGQAEEMAAALRRYDKQVELLTFWGEGHVLLSPANLREAYGRSFAALRAAFRGAHNHQ